MKRAVPSGSSVQDTVESSEWTVEVAQLWPPRGQWAEADYFALPDTNRYTELSEGELIVPPHPTDTHQHIILRLVRVLDGFVTEHDMGTIRFAPLPVRLWPGKIREPDVLFVSREHEDRIGEQVYGPPDLAVEVLSPGTRRTDRLEKSVEYARAGVGEYWIVDPGAQTVEVFVLREGAYELLGKWGRGDAVRSEVLTDFTVPVDEVMEGR